MDWLHLYQIKRKSLGLLDVREFEAIVFGFVPMEACALVSSRAEMSIGCVAVSASIDVNVSEFNMESDKFS